MLPWLYLILVPAISMRFWPEERESGSIELLLTQPITMWQAVLGKFLAGWLFIGSRSRSPAPLVDDHLARLARQRRDLGRLHRRLLMAGAYLAVGSFMSALTRSQVIAFILAFVVCFLS